MACSSYRHGRRAAPIQHWHPNLRHSHSLPLPGERPLPKGSEAGTAADASAASSATTPATPGPATLAEVSGALSAKLAALDAAIESLPGLRRTPKEQMARLAELSVQIQEQEGTLRAKLEAAEEQLEVSKGVIKTLAQSMHGTAR